MLKVRSLADAIKKWESCKITKVELRNLLENGTLGRVTGVIGPFVLRYHKGRLIISNRPFYFKMSMSPMAIAGRKNFAAKVKLARFLYNDNLIRKVWTNADIEGVNTWNRLIKHNNIKDLYPTIKNVITPAQYHLNIGQICSLREDFCIKINANYCSDEKDTICVVVVPFEPVHKSDVPFEILSITGSLLCNEIQLNENQIAICKKYKKFVMYTAVIRHWGDLVEWSNTASTQGSFWENSTEEINSDTVISKWYLLIHPYTLLPRRKHVYLYIMSLMPMELARSNIIENLAFCSPP